MKTIGAFFQFILDDPIMLGLCLAILVLIILFVIVLFLGKKADREEQKNEAGEELLETQVDLNVLNETYKESELETNTAIAMEVPVTIEEKPIQVEISPTEALETFSKTEPIPSFEDFKIEAPTPEEIKEATGELKPVGFDLQPQQNEEPKEMVGFNLQPKTIEVPTEPVGFDLQPEAKNEPIVFKPEDYIVDAGPSIIESNVNPIEDENANFDMEKQLMSSFNFSIPETKPQVDSIEKEEVDLPRPKETVEPVKDLPVEPPRPIQKAPIERSTFEKEETLRDIYGYEDVEIPEIAVEDFSRTAIIRHIPVLDSKLSTMFEVKPSGIITESDDDVDLPKLNTATNGTGLNALHGESFDIPKNS